jgi:hypothetical protein
MDVAFAASGGGNGGPPTAAGWPLILILAV